MALAISQFSFCFACLVILMVSYISDLDGEGARRRGNICKTTGYKGLYACACAIDDERNFKNSTTTLLLCCHLILPAQVDNLVQ